MPVQTQMSSFAARVGGRVAAANAEHAGKPVDTGNRRLPGGIRTGIAKLSTMYTKQQTEDNAKTPKGETFFRASAIVVSPEQHNGEKVAGMVTQVVIPLCDVQAKGERKAKTFSENWYEFQNLFKLLGINPPNETPQTDPTGQRTEAYYMAAMKTLTDPKRAPVYVEFSTRGWTPPKTQQNPNPDEMVFETWHGLAQWNRQFDPEAPPTQPQQGTVDIADEVASLVMTAMNDPEGATEEGAAASARLEQLAWNVGWTEEQTKVAADWAAVGDMVLNTPITATTLSTTTQSPGGPIGNLVVVGSKFKFAKRTKEGTKLKNNKGEEFPPQDVEVVTVDAAAQTCTLKTTKDGKDVVDIRTKKPIDAKWEWLE